MEMNIHSILPEEIAAMGGHSTVSYTHLDVYKRQEHGVVEFEVGGFEDEIELSSVPDREDGANFTPGREKDPCLLYTSSWRGLPQPSADRLPEGGKDSR